MNGLVRLYRRMEARYRRMFFIEEIERGSILQWELGALLLFFFVTFDRWVNQSNVTIEAAQRGTAVCWEYFQNCTKLYFLHDIGHGYSQALFYMALYGVMLGIVYLMWKKEWAAAHLLLGILWLWEVFVVFVLSFSDGAPYYYYHIILTAVFLFAWRKEFFLKLAFVFMYFMSVTTKLDSTWILGSYFTALRDGLPLFPDSLSAPITNLVIAMQMIGSWFLISKNRLLQRLAFLYFLAFHLYSGVFVLYFYPSVSLPSLIVLFGPMYTYTRIPFGKKVWIGYVILLIVALFQMPGFLASSDRRMTLEDNKFGMFMFEANHQCAVTVDTYYKNPPRPAQDFESAPGTPCPTFFCQVKRVTALAAGGLTMREQRYESGTAWNRCYPYQWWFQYHTLCQNNKNVDRIALRIDHSINGGPFYRIVDVPNICDLPYHAFGGNDWIKGPPEAPIIGYPLTNTYH